MAVIIKTRGRDLPTQLRISRSLIAILVFSLAALVAGRALHLHLDEFIRSGFKSSRYIFEGGNGAFGLVSPPSLLEGNAGLFRQIDLDLEPFKGGITADMVENAYCAPPGQGNGARVQIVDGQVYIAGYNEGYKTRVHAILRSLLDVASKYKLPNVDFVYNQLDHPPVAETSPKCPSRGPVLAVAKRNISDHQHVLLAPDWSFTEWDEVHFFPWGQMWQLGLEAVQTFPWEHRLDKLYFRGNAYTNPFRKDVKDQAAHWQEKAKAANGIGKGSLTDIEMAGMQGYITLWQHARNKWLLHMRGNSYSARLKYLLALGSAVVFVRDMEPNQYYEFFFHLLENGTHFLDIQTPNDTAYDALDRAATWLQQHDTEAKQMAKAGRALITEQLTADVVQEYWYRLIVTYASLQRFNVTRLSDSVPLGQAVFERANQNRECRC